MASDPLRQYRGTTCYHLCSLQPVKRLRGKGVHNGWEGGGKEEVGSWRNFGHRSAMVLMSMSRCSRLHRRHQEQESVRNLWPPQVHASVEVHLWQLQRGVWKSACICVA